jgi:hypothetical protein
MQEIKHKNCVKLFGFYETTHNFIFIMEYCENNLFDFLANTYK